MKKKNIIIIIITGILLLAIMLTIGGTTILSLSKQSKPQEVVTEKKDYTDSITKEVSNEEEQEEVSEEETIEPETTTESTTTKTSEKTTEKTTSTSKNTTTTKANKTTTTQPQKTTAPTENKPVEATCKNWSFGKGSSDAVLYYDFGENGIETGDTEFLKIFREAQALMSNKVYDILPEFPYNNRNSEGAVDIAMCSNGYLARGIYVPIYVYVGKREAIAKGYIKRNGDIKWSFKKDYKDPVAESCHSGNWIVKDNQPVCAD